MEGRSHWPTELRGFHDQPNPGTPNGLPLGPQRCPYAHQSAFLLRFQTKFITSFSVSSCPSSESHWERAQDSIFTRGDTHIQKSAPLSASTSGPAPPPVHSLINLSTHLPLN